MLKLLIRIPMQCHDCLDTMTDSHTCEGNRTPVFRCWGCMDNDRHDDAICSDILAAKRDLNNNQCLMCSSTALNEWSVLCAGCTRCAIQYKDEATYVQCSQRCDRICVFGDTCRFCIVEVEDTECRCCGRPSGGDTFCSRDCMIETVRGGYDSY